MVVQAFRAWLLRDLWTVFGARGSGALHPAAARFRRPLAYRADDGDDLAIADMADDAALGDVTTLGGQLDLQVDCDGLLGDRQVLARRPHDRLAGRLLQGHDARRQADAAEQRSFTARHRLVHLQLPAVGVDGVGEGQKFGAATTMHGVWNSR